MLLLLIALTFGGVLLPETSPCCSESDEWPAYGALRQICSKPVLGAVTMTTAMPIYVCVVLAQEIAHQLWALTELVWDSSAGKVLFTLGGWLLLWTPPGSSASKPASLWDDA